jgi:hypothetical protein
MRRVSFIPFLVLSVVLALSVVPSTASAITLREIVELSRAGLGDDVLLALIEIDPRVYPVDSDTLRMLKESGVSEKVIVAMVKSGRTQPAQLEQVPLDMLQPPPPPEPHVVVVERERPVIREVAVPVPVYVAVPVVRRAHEHDYRVEEPRRPAPPVYWGWGGKLRPDAWKPTEETQPSPNRRNNPR